MQSVEIFNAISTALGSNLNGGLKLSKLTSGIVCALYENELYSLGRAMCVLSLYSNTNFSLSVTQASHVASEIS